MRGDILDIINMIDYKFFGFNRSGAQIIFSTAEGRLDFNKATEQGRENLEKLKEWFSLEEVGFLNQVHSDDIFIYDGNCHEGDGLITDKKGIGIGVFTADCVPVLIYDEKKRIIAAVHSGWKGTLKKISSKAVIRMMDEYGCKAEDINVFIGPHNRSCCYEVGQEVAVEFMEDEAYSGMEIVVNNKLNLEKCIKKQLQLTGIKEENIKSTEICTYCSDEYKLHSYRKHKEASGRMFSFIYLTN